MITTLISRHEILCQDVEWQRKKYIKRIAELAAGGRKPTSNPDDYYVESHHHYVLQPLFGALIILAPSDFYLTHKPCSSYHDNFIP